jgi:RHS repeat-associated protein
VGGQAFLRYLGFRVRQLIDQHQLVVVAAQALVVLAAVLTITGLPAGAATARVVRTRPPLEVSAMRTADSDTFVSGDGNFTTHVYAQPVNYRDSRGAWRRIVSRFQRSGLDGYSLRSGANSFRVDLKSKAENGLLRFDPSSGAPFTLSLHGAATVSAVRDASELTYPRVLPQTDLQYALLPQGVKESLVLHSKDAGSTFRFALRPTATNAKLTATRQKDGSFAFSKDGAAQPEFTLAAPIVRDSVVGKPLVRRKKNGRRLTFLPEAEPATPQVGASSMNVDANGDGTFTVTLSIDRSWLDSPHRVFPVILDPTIDNEPDLLDGYWNTAAPSGTANMTDPELQVGQDGTGANFAAALQFNLSALPPAAHVTAANVAVYGTRCLPTSTAPGATNGCPPTSTGALAGAFDVYTITSPWSSTTPWSAITTDSTSLGESSGTFYQASGGVQVPLWMNFNAPPLVGQVQAIIDGNVPNNGFLLKTTSGSAAGLAFAGSRYADLTRAPQLTIQWSADGVELATPRSIHSNGADLYWQHASAGPGPYASAILADSPTAYWRLDDASASGVGIVDWTGNGEGGTATGGVTLGQPGHTADGDQSVSLDGSSGYIRVNEGAPLDAIGDTFTLEAWVKRAASATGLMTVFSRGVGTGGGFRLQLTPSGNLELAGGDFDGSTYHPISTSTSAILDTGWHHVAATKDGASVHLYIDGTDVTGTVNNQTLTNGWGKVIIGANVSNSSGETFSSYWNGQIDEPAVYNHVLSASQIWNHVQDANLTASPFSGYYEIYRSIVQNFSPSPSTLIATIRDPSVQTYRDTTAKPGTTFYYEVETHPSGSSSNDLSNEVSATTPADGQATITLQPGIGGAAAKATAINSANACATQGAEPSIPVDATDRGLIQFDLRQIPNGATVNSAELDLFTFSNPSATIEAHRVTSDWTEGTAAAPTCDGTGASWADRSPSVAWTTPGGDFDPTTAATASDPGGNPHWDSFSGNGMKDLVQKWLDGTYANLGVLLKHANESSAPSIEYVSNDYGTSLAFRPKLVINYTDGSHANAPSVGVGIQGVSALPGVNPAVKGTVTLTAGASDDGQVSSVQFYVDGNPVGSPVSSPPYTYSWNTTALHGTHVVSATGTDDAGNQTPSPTVTVNAANSAAPTVNVTNAAPSSGANWTATASASDDIGVTRVDFLVDGSLVGSATNSPYTVSFDTLSSTTPIYDGQHSLTAVAYDADGNSTTSAVYRITVANTAGTKYRGTITTTDTGVSSITPTIPVGAVLPYAGAVSSIPTGWALANGAAVSRTTDSDLFTAIGTSYGSGDGATTFNLPDLAGRIPLGAAASGTGSVLGQSVGGLDQSGTIALSNQSYSFSWTDAPSTPSFADAQELWNGPFGPSTASTGQYTYMHSNISPITVTSSQSGTVSATAASATGTAAVSATFSASDPPFRVLNYIVKVAANAATPDCLVWPSAAPSTPTGTTAADGSPASGVLSTCLDPSFSGNVPDLRGEFPLGQRSSGTASTLNGTGGALAQTASVAYASGAGVASITPSPYSVPLTVSQPAPSLSYSTYRVVENSATSGYGQVSSVSAGSNNGGAVTSNSVNLGTLSTNGPSGSATTGSYTAPYLALNYAAPTASSFAPVAGLMTAYGGNTTPTGWLRADGSCYDKATYPDLFAAIGYTYGGAASVFCVPDMRGRLPIGKTASGDTGTLGATGGALDATPSASLPGWTPHITVPAHTVSWNVPNHTHQIGLVAYGGDGNGTWCCDHPPNVTIISSAVIPYTGTTDAFGGQTVSGTTSAQPISSTAVGAQQVTLPAQNAPAATMNYLIAVGSTIGARQDSSVSSGVPVGSVLPYAGSVTSLPTGWALADGAAVSRTADSDLFSAIGTAYGSGDGSTTFNLPNLVGRFPLGQADAGTGSTLGGSGGSLTMGGGSTTLPSTGTLSFPTPATAFTLGAIPSFTPPGMSSVSTTYHYNFWGGDSELYALSVGAGGGQSSGWSSFTVPSLSGTGGAVTPTATLSTATTAYRVVRYIVKTAADASVPPCVLWPAARTNVPDGSQAADGSTAGASTSSCLDSTLGGHEPDLRRVFPLGQAASGDGSTMNASGGNLDLTQTVTRTVPTSSVTVPNYATSVTIPGGNYPVTYYYWSYGGGNNPDVWTRVCSGYGAGGMNDSYVPAPGPPAGSCLPAYATTPAVTTGQASGAGGTYTTLPKTTTTSTGVLNPAFTTVRYYTGPTSPDTGVLVPYGGPTPPPGWLVADGSCVSQTDYGDLFTAIGTAYGTCPAGEFKLPDMRGRLPLGLSASGTGSTLGATGGTTDIKPSVSLPAFTPQFNWAPAPFTFSIPNRQASLSIGGANQHQYAGSSQYGVTQASVTSGAFGATTVTGSAPTQLVNGTPVGATTVTFPTENPPYQVFKYLIYVGPSSSTTGGSIVPDAMRYDPNTGSQDSDPVTVTLTNTSSTTWSASTVKLRYRWLNPDGSELAQSGNLSIGSTDLAPSAQRNVQITLDPPTLPAPTMRGRFTLRFDLYDTTCSCYFASQGNQPLDRTVEVTRDSPDELGLERYQQYDGVDTGVGTASVNLFNGNLAFSHAITTEPGVGLNTAVGLVYNSMEIGSTSPAGNGFSLGVSGLLPLGQHLDIHPNPDDLSAGRSTPWIGFTDSDGTYHRFVGNASGTYYTAPPGVHLYLGVNTADPQRHFGFYKPDRTAYFFDVNGWPTQIVDKDGNAISFNEAPAPADAYGVQEQITSVTDARGRSFTLAYYGPEDTEQPQLLGKLRSITDHIGHQWLFDYYNDGNLLAVTEKGGTNADGSYLPDRRIVLTYVNAAGTGAAIASHSTRLNPDPATTEGKRLYSVVDYKGQETTFGYGSGQVTSITDRAGNTTTYSYSPATSTTTVTRPLGRTWSYAFDTQGRVTSIIDPLNETTGVSWTADNEVQKLTEPTGGANFTEYAYDANGDLTDKWDELRDHTSLSYQSGPVDANDKAANWETGRTIGHFSRIASLTTPQGNATTTPTTDYTTTFSYAAGADAAKDRVIGVTDAAGNTETLTYYSDGTLATDTKPSNGDGITRTTTFNSYDANGNLTEVTDAAGGVAQAGYDAAGDLLWTQDPLHGSYSGGDSSQYRSYSYYDSYGRVGRTSSPKSTSLAPGVLIWTDTSYDANDNVLSASNPHYGYSGDSGVAPAASTSYDAMDRPTFATSPRSTQATPIQTETEYDAAGRVTRTTKPNGVATSVARDYSTETTYDLLDRPTQVTQVALNGSSYDATNSRVTSYCYDLAGDLRSVTGPKGFASFTSCPAATAPSSYVYTTTPYTTEFQYDPAHRQIGETNPDGTTTAQTYNAGGAKTSSTDENNATTYYYYDDRGLENKTVVPFNSSRTITSLTTYNALGNVSTQISPRAYDTANGSGTYTQYVTTFAYDALGRLVKTTLPTAGTAPASYLYKSYDANGDVTMTSLPTAQTSVASLAPYEQTTDTYLDTGAIATQTNPSTPTVHFDYAAEGWQSARIPDEVTAPGTLNFQQAQYWQYLPDGLLAALSDLGGQRAYYSYDANGNQTNAAQADGITQATQQPMTVQRSFDQFDELAKTRSSLSDGSGNYLATLYSYDLSGLTTSLISNQVENGSGAKQQEGRTLAYTYNSLGLPLTQTDNFSTPSNSADDEQLAFTYTPTGYVSTRALSKANGSGGWTAEQIAAWTYYSNGLLNKLTTSDGNGNIVEQHTLSYLDSNGVYIDGNKTSDAYKQKQADGSSTCWAANCTTTWTYDPLDRLTSQTDTAGSGTSSTFTLDVEGNILADTENGTQTTNTYTGQKLTSTTNAGKTTLNLYDSSGNLDCVVKSTWTQPTCPAPHDPALLTDYVYDYKNRLSAVRTYADDGSGNVTTQTDYVNDPLDRVASEVSATGVNTTSPATTTTAFQYLGETNGETQETLTGTGATTKTFLLDPSGQRITMTDSATNTRLSYLYNPHGDVSGLINQSNGLLETYAYGPYGGALVKPASGFDPNKNLNPFTYSGKRWDAASSTFDMGARRYSPSSERFLQQDIYQGALADLDLSTNPLSSNRYEFTGANPINYVEVDGHMLAAVDGGVRYAPKPKPKPTGPDPGPGNGPSATAGPSPTGNSNPTGGSNPPGGNTGSSGTTSNDYNDNVGHTDQDFAQAADDPTPWVRYSNCPACSNYDVHNSDGWWFIGVVTLVFAAPEDIGAAAASTGIDEAVGDFAASIGERATTEVEDAFRAAARQVRASSEDARESSRLARLYARSRAGSATKYNTGSKLADKLQWASWQVSNNLPSTTDFGARSLVELAVKFLYYAIRR